VRELDNVMQRALILQPGKRIGVMDLGLQTQSSFSEKPSLIDAMDAPDVNTLHYAPSTFSVEEPSNTFVDASIDDAILLSDDSHAALGTDLRKHEFDIIVKTLKQERGSKKNTAVKLGISARTLRYKMARLREEGYNLEAVMS